MVRLHGDPLMFNIDDETRRRIYASTDLLFDQLRRCPIDELEIKDALKRLSGLTDPEPVISCLSAAGLTLRDPEELGNALHRYGFSTNETIDVLTLLAQQSQELMRLFASTP